MAPIEIILLFPESYSRVLNHIKDSICCDDKSHRKRKATHHKESSSIVTYPLGHLLDGLQDDDSVRSALASNMSPHSRDYRLPHLRKKKNEVIKEMISTRGTFHANKNKMVNCRVNTLAVSRTIQRL
jgi:hypothetical protein